MFHWVTEPSAWIALATLTALELVLGIDNIIFISILVGKLPESERASARRLGLLLAMGMRIGLLVGLTWIMGLTRDLLTVFGHGWSGKDVILLSGGLFLIVKSTMEIHDKLEGEKGHASAHVRGVFGAVIVQIVLLDLVFSLDSVITAIGMAQQIGVMILAVVLAVIMMMALAGPIGDFVHRHPTFKILALAFLLLIGVTLVAESFGQHINKGYIYFAMAFSFLVELLNLKIVRSREGPLQLREPYAK